MEKTREDIAAKGCASVFFGLGCAPFLLIPVWIGLAIILSFLFGVTAGVIIASIIVIAIFIFMVVGGVFNIGRSVVTKTLDISCPYCDTHNQVLKNVKTFPCKECKKQVLVKNGVGQKLI